MDALSHALSPVVDVAVTPRRITTSDDFAVELRVEESLSLACVRSGTIHLAGEGVRDRVESGSSFVLRGGQVLTMSTRASAVPSASVGPRDHCGPGRSGPADLATTWVDGVSLHLDTVSATTLLGGTLPPVMVAGHDSDDGAFLRTTILRLREEALGGLPGASAAATSLAQLACLTALRATESDGAAATWPTPALVDPVLGAALRRCMTIPDGGGR
jgi:hypothetical protein